MTVRRPLGFSQAGRGSLCEDRGESRRTGCFQPRREGLAYRMLDERRLHKLQACNFRQRHWHHCPVRAGNRSGRFNLGNGSGFYVAQVIETVESITGKALPINYVERRCGDPAILVADATHARAMLGWSPQYDSLETIIRHAWKFEQRNCAQFALNNQTANS